jgi:hypothetical protein
MKYIIMAFVAFNSFQRMAANKRRVAVGGGGGGIITNGLIVYYTFDTGTYTSNSLANLASGTVVYDASFSVSSSTQIVTGSAAVGDSYFSVNNNYIYRTVLTTIGLNGFTMCMWMFITSGSNAILGSIGGSAVSGPGIYSAMSGSSFVLNNASAAYGSRDVSNTVTSTWSHHAHTVTSSNIVLHYQNGSLTSPPTFVGTMSYPFTTGSFSYGCCLGTVYANNSGQYVNGGSYVGGIDDFRVYTRALSASEINQIYNKLG